MVEITLETVRRNHHVGRWSC